MMNSNHQFNDLQPVLEAVDTLAVPPSHKAVLAEIVIREAAPDETPVFTYSEIADQLNISRSAASRAGLSLANLGLISRRRVQNNAYRHNLNMSVLQRLATEQINPKAVYGARLRLNFSDIAA